MFHLKSRIHVVPVVSIALALFLTLVAAPDCAQIYIGVPLRIDHALGPAGPAR